MRSRGSRICWPSRPATSISAASSPMRSGNGGSAGSWRRRRARQAEPHYRRAFELRRELVLDPRVEPSIVAEELVKLAQLTSTLAGTLEARGRKPGGRGSPRRMPLPARPWPGGRSTPAAPPRMCGRSASTGPAGRRERPPGRGGGPPPGTDPRSRPRQARSTTWPGSWPACPTPRPTTRPQALEAARKAVSLEARELDALEHPGRGRLPRRRLEGRPSEALEKSMSLNKGGEAADWFFLAMTRWRQGQPAEARKWFDRAVAWTRKNQPGNPELQRFQAEAEAAPGHRPRSPRARSRPPRVDRVRRPGRCRPTARGRRG